MLPAYAPQHGPDNPTEVGTGLGRMAEDRCTSSGADTPGQQYPCRMPVDRFHALYRVRCSPDTITSRARALALEQSIEMPIEAVRDARIRSRIAGEVAAIEPVPGAADRFDVSIALASETTGAEPGQLLNMACGNCSLQPDVELLDLELPPALLAAMPGPRYGSMGWRRIIAGLPPGNESARSCAEGSRNDARNRHRDDDGRGEVCNDDSPKQRTRPQATALAMNTAIRPLSCTALKPQGLDAEALAALAYVFARAGIDVIKDDHGIADQGYAPFAQRVPLVQQAIERANRDKRAAGGVLAGHHSVYAPSLSGGPQRLARQLAIARDEGVGALLCCPLIVGIPVFAEMIRAEAGVPLLAHPALAGLPMAPALLLGRLFRLFGADATIFPNEGGRFSFSREQCLSIACRAREPLGAHRPSLPVPAGGMRVERIEEIVRTFGPDTMLLIGGDLLGAGDALADRASAFVQRLFHAAQQTPAELVDGLPGEPARRFRDVPRDGQPAGPTAARGPDGRHNA